MDTNHIVAVQITKVIEKRYRVRAESADDAVAVMQDALDGPVSAFCSFGYLGTEETYENVEVWAVEENKIRYLVVGAGVTFATYDNFEDAESLRAKLDEALICTVSIEEEENV